MQSPTIGVQANARMAAPSPAQRSASYANRTRSDDSWVEIASQPSSSSLSSVGDEIVTTGLRVQHDPQNRRRRRLRPGAPTHLNITSRPPSVGETSSQEEYEESESESDRVMTSSNEGLVLPVSRSQGPLSSASNAVSDDDDENRTAINYPIRNEHCFTPQPNAFSLPPSSQASQNPGQQIPGSYFPGSSTRPAPHSSTRSSYPPVSEARMQHSPYNAISPSHNAAVDHDAALRASLSTLLSCAAAARGLPKSRQQATVAPPVRASNRVEPNTLRLVSQSQLPGASPPVQHLQEPTFNPTIRRTSTSTSTSAEDHKDKTNSKDAKRKATTARSSSKDRRISKKARRSSSSAYNADDIFVSPTLLTWVVSAGVVVVLSALSFSAGYSMGKEAGRLEAGLGAGSDVGCAREAGRTGLGLRRLRFATQV